MSTFEFRDVGALCIRRCSDPRDRGDPMTPVPLPEGEGVAAVEALAPCCGHDLLRHARVTGIGAGCGDDGCYGKRTGCRLSFWDALAEHDRAVRAEALREAAQSWDLTQNGRGHVWRWLRDRAALAASPASTQEER